MPSNDSDLIGVNYYLSCWYRRAEFGRRAAIFFSAAALAGSFGGLLAAAIAQMDGVGGKPGWAWIFIIEGLATVIIGALSYYMVHDFPDQATFLTESERARVIHRLKEDKQASAEAEAFAMRYVWAALKDWKMYAFAIIYMGCDGALYAFSLFTPSILSALGYSGTRANLLSVPPYACAAVLTVTIGFIADRTQQRGLCNIICAPIGIAGFIMLIASQNPQVKYAGLYLGALGIYPCIANTIVWSSNNAEGVFKRGVIMGVVIGWGNLNGVVSSNIYLARDKPKYYVGHGVVLAYMTVFLLGGSLVTRYLLARENKKRDNGERDNIAVGLTEQEVKDLGDWRPDFRYTL